MMLNFNNISLLVIILITLILIHINFKRNHIHNQNPEPFVVDNTFSDNLNEINEKLQEEINDSKHINRLLVGINEKNNQDKCFIVNRDSNNEITDIKYKNITDSSQCPINGIVIKPTTDLKKLRELNEEIKNTSININPILKNTDKIIKQKRINELNEQIKKLEEDNIINEDDVKTIRQIKNNFTGKSLNVKKVNPNDDNNSKYYIYLNSLYDNNNGGVEYRCLSYNKNNPENPYETKKCNPRDTKQHFDLDKIVLNKKCYDYPNTNLNKPNNKTLEECEGANVIKLENKKDFVEKINSKISDKNKFFRISESNIFTVPKQFSFISPIDDNEQCLTIDREGVSFQECVNNPSQQWNYSNENISC